MFTEDNIIQFKDRREKKDRRTNTPKRSAPKDDMVEAIVKSHLERGKLVEENLRLKQENAQYKPSRNDYLLNYVTIISQIVIISTWFAWTIYMSM